MESKNYRPHEHPYLFPLKERALAPKRLAVAGIMPDHRITSIAIVGSRRPTPYGTEITYELAYTLAQRGVIIISGLAFGIDATAHRAALDAGGRTIAVLPAGLDHIYPASHRQLAQAIVNGGGALMTEYGRSVSARKHHFLARNRLVSGLADAVVVTEAGERSGTLSTVNHALEQGRDVFAVPGPITSPLSIGPNRLISQGAVPILSLQDFLDTLGIEGLRQAPSTGSDQSLLALIKKGFRTTDQLVKESGLDAAALALILTQFEMNGTISRQVDGSWIVQG